MNNFSQYLKEYTTLSTKTIREYTKKLCEIENEIGNKIIFDEDFKKFEENYLYKYKKNSKNKESGSGSAVFTLLKEYNKSKIYNDTHLISCPFTKGTLAHGFSTLNGNTSTGNISVKYKTWLDKYGTEDLWNSILKACEPKKTRSKKTISKVTFSTIYVNNVLFKKNAAYTVTLKEDFKGDNKGRMSLVFTQNESSETGIKNKILLDDIIESFGRFTVTGLQIIDADKVNLTCNFVPDGYPFSFAIYYKNMMQENSAITNYLELSNGKIYYKKGNEDVDKIVSFFSIYNGKLYFDKKEVNNLVTANDIIFNILSFYNSSHNLVEKNIPIGSEIRKTYNMIYFGAPGSSKSYELNELVREHKHKRVTFHSDYEYSDFIGSIKPVLNEGSMTYEFVPGIFTSLLKDALNAPNEEHYLVIEELTRGNSAGIFGDIFQLLDRNESGASSYPINNTYLEKYLGVEEVILPHNFYIYATVNNSDQNVYPMDTAFKRRFDFKYFEPIGSNYPEFELLGYEWKTLATNINTFIVNQPHLGEDKQIGGYFIKDGSEASLKKLLMYLWFDIDKYVANDNERITNYKVKEYSKYITPNNLEYKKLFSKKFIEEFNND